MFARTPPQPLADDKAASRREQRRERKLRRAVRIAAGLACTGPVEYDSTMLDFLIATHWLAEADESDSKKIGEAVSRMWRDTAYREK
jgi:hypothetical protein